MTVSEDRYQEDEFDRQASHYPVGMHRQTKPRWKEVLPFIIIIVVVPLVAWAFTLLFLQGPRSSSSKEASSSPTKTTQSATPQQSSPRVRQQHQDQSSSRDNHSQGSHSAADNTNYSLVVKVLNIDNSPQVVDSVSHRLTDEGYQSVGTGKSAGRGIHQSSVYYSSPTSQAAAQDIAKKLNISTVLPSAQFNKQNKSDIVIFIKNDYRPTR